MVDGTSCALRANLAPRTVYARGLHMLGGSLYELRYLKKKKKREREVSEKHVEREWRQIFAVATNICRRVLLKP